MTGDEQQPDIIMPLLMHKSQHSLPPIPTINNYQIGQRDRPNPAELSQVELPHQPRSPRHQNDFHVQFNNGPCWHRQKYRLTALNFAQFPKKVFAVLINPRLCLFPFPTIHPSIHAYLLNRTFELPRRPESMFSAAYMLASPSFPLFARQKNTTYIHARTLTRARCCPWLQQGTCGLGT